MRSFQPRLNIHVEGKSTKTIVEKILKVAEIKGDIVVEAEARAHHFTKLAASLSNSESHRHIILVDADLLSIFDSRQEAERKLKRPNVKVLCAVPTIEAWLFADDQLAIESAKNEHAAQILQRLPLPESIPYPKYLASKVFSSDQQSQYHFLDRMDIARATSRSPSLREFLASVLHELQQPRDLTVEALRGSIGRDAFSTLLRELPSAEVVWKTVDGVQLRADELAREISEGTDLGKQYVSDVLRVARDMIARRAKR